MKSPNIAIIGAAHREKPPLKDHQSWTVGRHWTADYDRAYELHPYEKAQNWIFPIPPEQRYVLFEQPYAANLIRRPEILKISEFGLTSTIAWMIADAILQNPTTLTILGCPMLAPAPGVSWWLGIAKGLGIKIAGDHNFVGTAQYGT